MTRRTRAAAVTLAAILSVGGSVAAQDAAAEVPAGPELAVLCATVSGDPAAGAWTEVSLTEALSAGDAGIEQVSEAATCAQSSDDADAGASLPLEIVESHTAESLGSLTYVTIVRNPNDPGVALDMPVRVDALDGNGERVGFAYTDISLLPGQTGVLSGTIVVAAPAVRTELVFPEYDPEFAFEAPTDASIEFAGVETNLADPSNPRTTGTLLGMPGDTSTVQLTAIYRDESGNIVGAGSTFIDQPPGQTEVKFEVSGFVDGDVAKTDLYYQVSR